MGVVKHDQYMFGYRPAIQDDPVSVENLKEIVVAWSTFERGPARYEAVQAINKKLLSDSGAFEEFIATDETGVRTAEHAVRFGFKPHPVYVTRVCVSFELQGCPDGEECQARMQKRPEKAFLGRFVQGEICKTVKVILAVYQYPQQLNAVRVDGIKGG